MGRIRVIYDETANQLVKLQWWGDLKLNTIRRIQTSKHRYCLHGSIFFTPDDKTLGLNHRLSWGMIDPMDIEDYPFLDTYGITLPKSPEEIFKEGLIISGSNYSKRHREEDGKRVPVEKFLADEFFDKVLNDQSGLDTLSKSEFESLCAEVFARKGFEVDLFRTTKDDGIDFLAITGEIPEPIIWSIQCKLPEKERKGGKKARLATVREVREIYGVTKAHDYHKALLISGTAFSREAKKFQELQPSEIELIEREMLMKWISAYRWNNDE